MTRLTLLILLLCLGCKSVKKDVAKSTTKTDLQTTTTETHESSISTRTQQQELLQQFHSSLASRDGLLSIGFDSLTVIDISPDGRIRATGYAPKILSSTAETHRDTSASLSHTYTGEQTDSTGQSKREDESTLETEAETLDSSTERKPSLMPYLGVGLVIIGVLWYLFLRLKK